MAVGREAMASGPDRAMVVAASGAATAAPASALTERKVLRLIAGKASGMHFLLFAAIRMASPLITAVRRSSQLACQFF
ncbi:hypothetical protein IP81_05055 [Novosphingobium sp. AAP83]|nr:hypothetical protein IP81_05055 [Novosphingobium sp. AAP83]